MSGQTPGGVVVGYDGSAPAAAAVAWAAREASAASLPLTVLYVADDTWVPGLGADELLMDQTRRTAAEGVKLAAERSATLHPHPAVAVGSAAGALVHASREAALLVVGNRGRGEIMGALAGSVAFAVTAHAECPAIVVRGDPGVAAGSNRPVVVGVDGSPAADAAVRFACEHAALHHAPMRVVAVCPPIRTQDWEFAARDPLYPGDESSDVGAVAIRRAREWVGRGAALAAEVAPNVAVTTEIMYGPPGRILAEASRDAGLLVVGSRGHGGFAGLLLGSVSHAVIHAASCPVAVTRT